MLLTLSTTHQPATDLGYLLHKHPDRAQSFSLTFGQAHVFYPEASTERCTAALLLAVDTVHLVRGRAKSAALEQYVNDRPYVASSFLSVALADIFRSALNGKCLALPALVEQELPLQVQLSALPSRGGESWIRRLFEPLGYSVTATRHPLDEQHPEWGLSNYYTVTLSATCRLRDLLTHLYVLIPVLDGDKHYWIGDDEVEKLLHRGKGWLETHPEREQIAYRYLKHKPDLTRDALARLVIEERVELSEPAESVAAGEDEQVEPAESVAAGEDEQVGPTESVVAGEDEQVGPAEKTDKPQSLHQQRLLAVMAALEQSGATSVLDLGCGEGRLLKMLLQKRSFGRILGMDVSYRALELAQARLHWERMPDMQKKRISLIHGSLMYRDKRLEGYDAAAVIEVIEHLDPPRLAAFERVLFEFARPGSVMITTPNAEYNVKYETLSAGTFRHKDHRFEWTRQEFQDWGARLAQRYGYTVNFSPLGPADLEVGAPSQMGIFSRAV